MTTKPAPSPTGTSGANATPTQNDLVIARGQEADAAHRLKVLASPINWGSHASANLITGAEAEVLIRYCQTDSGDQGAVAAAFLSALGNIATEDTKQYVLTRIDDMLDAATRDGILDPNCVAAFHGPLNNGSPYDAFFHVLQDEDDVAAGYSLGKACNILSRLLSSPVKGAELAWTRATQNFFRWLISSLDRFSGKKLHYILHALKDLLKKAECRSIFASNFSPSDLISSLAKLKRKGEEGDALSKNTQLLYVLCFIFWVLSYEASVFQSFVKAHVVRFLVDVVENVTREKVVRVALAALQNMKKHKGCVEELIALGLHKSLALVKSRKWKDADLIADLEDLSKALETIVNQLSNFEMYRSEMATEQPKLRWTVVHSEQFWRENYQKFEPDSSGQYVLINQLIDILNEETDPVCLAVVAYDLGEFARFHPEGKRVVGQKAKPGLLNLMTHKNPETSTQALIATQKIMVKSWEALQSVGGITSI